MLLCEVCTMILEFCINYKNSKCKDSCKKKFALSMKSSQLSCQYMMPLTPEVFTPNSMSTVVESTPSKETTICSRSYFKAAT